MNPSTVRVRVLVMPTPFSNGSAKYVRPSSRTATPQAAGVSTFSTILPGLVPGSHDTAVVAANEASPERTEFEVGGSSTQPIRTADATPHRSTPAGAARRIETSNCGWEQGTEKLQCTWDRNKNGDNATRGARPVSLSRICHQPPCLRHPDI